MDFLLASDCLHVLSDQEVSELKEMASEGLQAEDRICKYNDFILSSWNPVDHNEWVKPAVHACKRKFLDISHHESDDDYADLVNSVERHTKCSSAYCVRTDKDGNQNCRFNFPIEETPQTYIKFEEVNSKKADSNYRATIVSKRNDTRVNRHQRIQLQGWRANCDIQLIIDHHACVEYLAKYASKGEKMSSVVRDAFVSVVSKLNDNTDPKAAIRKLMMKAVGERDMSIQEVMHHILSLKLYSSSFNVITVSLDGSRKCKLENGTLTTEMSPLDNYAERMTYSTDLSTLNFINFVSNYSVVNNELKKRKSPVIVRTVPSFSAYPNSKNYGSFCKYQLIKYKPWHTKPSNAWGNQEETDMTFTAHWHTFLETEIGKILVPNWHREIQNSQLHIDENGSELGTEGCNGEKEEWMYIAEMAKFEQTKQDSNNVLSEKNLKEHLNCFRSQYSSQEIASMPFWVERQKSESQEVSSYVQTDREISSLNAAQKRAYDIVNVHKSSANALPHLLMIITGQGGSGKSYIIDALRDLLRSSCLVCSYFGIAAFNVRGYTLHSIFHLPIRGKRNSDLKGQSLQKL